jgi:hypothetical protein
MARKTILEYGDTEEEETINVYGTQEYHVLSHKTNREGKHQCLYG